MNSRKEFEIILPDTSGNWSARLTKMDFYRTRQLESKLKLSSLTAGVPNNEVRIWSFHTMFDPQSLSILIKKNKSVWTVRKLLFYESMDDSISSDYIKSFPVNEIDSLYFNQLWNIPSQSDMANGDSVGCVDGGPVIIEIASTDQYKFLWFMCPDINSSKHPSFLLANDMRKKLDSLVVY